MAAIVLGFIGLVHAGLVGASPLEARAPPTVVLDSGTFTGVSAGLSSSFLGIPFAQPP